jgi:hypothetical protein
MRYQALIWQLSSPVVTLFSYFCAYILSVYFRRAVKASVKTNHNCQKFIEGIQCVMFHDQSYNLIGRKSTYIASRANAVIEHNVRLCATSIAIGRFSNIATFNFLYTARWESAEVAHYP